MNKNVYKAAIRDGCTVEYKDITLCDLRNFCYWMKNKERVFQVHSNKFTAIYSSLDEAVDKFIELRNNR